MSNLRKTVSGSAVSRLKGSLVLLLSLVALSSRGECPSPRGEGNGQPLPGGLCLEMGAEDVPVRGHVRKKWLRSSSKVSVDLSFLKKARLDETFAILRKGPGRCEFAITYPSPAAAMQILREDPNAPFFVLGDDPRVASAPYLAYHAKSGSTEYFCAKLDELSSLPTIRRRRRSRASSELWAAPGLLPTTEPEKRDLAALETAGLSPRLQRCLRASNGEISQALEASQAFLEYNELVETSLVRSLALIQKRIAERLPGCSIPAVGFPVLFSGQHVPANAAGGARLRAGTGVPITPDPVKASAAGPQMLFSTIENSSFVRAMEDALKEHGIFLRHDDDTEPTTP